MDEDLKGNIELDSNNKDKFNSENNINNILYECDSNGIEKKVEKPKMKSLMSIKWNQLMKMI